MITLEERKATGNQKNLRAVQRNTERWVGLSSEEAAHSAKEHGRNVLPTVKRKSFLSRFLSNLGDPVIRVLLFALILNIAFLYFEIGSGDIFETVGIAVSVLLATAISTVSEHSGDAAFQRLSTESAESVVRVKRDGKVREIKISDVVVGDIVLLSAGETVPADGRIVSGAIGCDQSVLTGESREARKYPKEDLKDSTLSPTDPASPSALFRGCTVLTGECLLLAERVGKDTFLGEISREVQEETRESPLKMRLSRLARQISVFGYIAAFLIAFAYLFVTFVVESGFVFDVVRLKFLDLSFVADSLLHALTLGLTVIVVAVPEGLPLMVAVVLSSNMKRMVKDRVLVRKPVGIESAGSMNLLFTDKTGTLTDGRLSVSEIFLGDLSTYGNTSKLRAHASLFRHYLLSARLNTASVFGSNETEAETAIGGNGTDRALLLSVPKEERKTSLPERDGFLPFDSTRKYSAAYCQGTVYLKGAPEKLLPFISSVLLKSGKTVPFAPLRKAFTDHLSKKTREGERIILIAFGEGMTPYDVECGRFGALTLLCAVALCDRIRPEAKRAVTDLRGAGIHVVMVTGDNRETALSIAERCGIIGNGVDTVLTGDELAKLSDVRLKELLPRLGVVARALPSDKSRLVTLAQELGLVVGMTGDGINDAPALKKADVGFCMGSGTSVAKEAGDIVILDNNLASVARAVLYGRTIFRSIRKFITLQLTMNFSAVGVTMLCPFFGIESPVTVVQMLWINLIMDTLGGLAFAGEAPMSFYMKEPPKKRDEPILNAYMVHQISILGGFTVLSSLLFLFTSFSKSHFRELPNDLCLLTAFFAFFIFTSVANCFNCRTDRLSFLAGLSKNRPFLYIMFFVLTVQILFVYLGGTVLRTVPLTAEELLYTFLLSLLVFPAEFLRKVLWRCLGHRRGF